MKRGMGYLVLTVIAGAACVASFKAGLDAQENLEGARFQSSAGGLGLEVLFDGERRDVPVDVAVITFPPGTNSGDHQHPQTEIFYVLEGALEHVVNGESTILTPGMVGHVKPPDFVNHITEPGGESTRAVVLWAPAGGASRIASRWERLPN
ncbi:MAG: cupin domain-containing protein [Longimicrobiales bacterium]